MAGNNSIDLQNPEITKHTDFLKSCEDFQNAINTYRPSLGVSVRDNLERTIKSATELARDNLGKILIELAQDKNEKLG